MGNYAKGNPFDILVNDVVSFCLHPKNLSVSKLKKFKLLSLLEGMSTVEY